MKKIDRKKYLHDYRKEYYPKYRKTIRGLLSIMYSSLRASSKKRKMDLPNFTKTQLKEWLLSQDNFTNIYNNWVNDNYSKNLRPSIDRLDDYKEYTFGNMTLTTWIKNCDKGHNDRRLGINNKKNTSVIQLDKITNKIIGKYHSMMEAQRQTGTSAGSIYNVLSGRNKTAGGFLWTR